MLQSPHHTVLIYSEPSVRALNRHAIEALAKIVGAHWPILISDTPQGGDALIQRWLMAREYDLVTVYHAQDNPRFNAGFKQTQKISGSSEDALTSMAQTATLGLVVVSQDNCDTTAKVKSLLADRYIKIVSPNGATSYLPPTSISTVDDAAHATMPATIVGQPPEVQASETIVQGVAATNIVNPLAPARQADRTKVSDARGRVGASAVGRTQLPNRLPQLALRRAGRATLTPSEFAERYIAACSAHGLKVTECDPDRVITGPRVHRFYFTLKSGQRIDRLQKVLPDIERETGRSGLLIQPVADSHDIALDCPHDKHEPVPLARALKLIEQLEVSIEALPVPVGVSPEGRDVIIDLSQGPHMLIAGTTGAGKTSFMHGLLLSLIHTHPDPTTLRLFLVSSKLEDFTCFASLPHLEGGKCFSDPVEAMEQLQHYLQHDFHERAALLVQSGCANGLEYNRKRNRSIPPMAPLVICIDEFADLVDEIDDHKARKAFYGVVRRLAQAGRSKLIFLIIGTQRPSADLIPAGLRDLLNARVALRCNSGEASRMILNAGGAEKLLLRGDLLFQSEAQLLRLQGYYMPLDQVSRQLARYAVAGKKNEVKK